MTQQSLRPIRQIAQDLEIPEDWVLPYGHDKAKVQLAALANGRPPGKLVLVSGTNPTDAGEGKTVTTIGLAQGLAACGKRACVALREPSLGPVFGRKGGATGGGRSRVEPFADINLHFTGDFPAVAAANNLLAALLDNHLHYRNPLGIDPRRVLWRRVIDLNDRALRQILIGLGGPGQGIPREAGFDITPASEVMAVLCLASDEEDLRRRLARMIVALTWERQPVTAADLKAVGSLLVLLKDALLPNLVQTTEGVPAFVHGGPFANIAHGCNSVLATRMALAHADWVVTEAGFGFELGGEKFLDLKCRSAGLDPAVVVLVASARALKLHGGVKSPDLERPDPAAVVRGFANLEQHIAGVRLFGRTPVVAINRFPADSAEELAEMSRACAALGVPSAISEVFTRGGEGGRELAAAVIAQAALATAPITPLYPATAEIRDQVQTIATRIYGADDVIWSSEAQQDLAQCQHLGYGQLPVCIAKTQKSLSDDPSLLGRPRGFKIKVQRLLLAAGAGFAIPLLGDIMRLPGLPKVPQAESIDLVDGQVVGVG